jgi:hypothetical protein
MVTWVVVVDTTFKSANQTLKGITKKLSQWMNEWSSGTIECFVRGKIFRKVYFPALMGLWTLVPPLAWNNGGQVAAPRSLMRTCSG